MNVAGIQELIKDVEFAFGLPLVGFVLALINIRMTRRSKFNPLKVRLSLSFVLVLFVCLCVLMFQDRLVLINLWRCSPVMYSFVYCVIALLVVVAIIGLVYWKLRPGQWKDREG
jgi:hypothetical protein